MYVFSITIYAILAAIQRTGIHAMKRTTIFADDALLAEIRQASSSENKSAAQFIREALQSHLAARRAAPKPNRFAFIGKYKSSRTDVAEKHEQLLWSDKR